MDFFGRVFGSAFFGHDWSLLIFGSIMFILLSVQAVFLFVALLDKTEGERTPTWAWVTMLIIPLVVGALGISLFLTS